MGALNFHGQAQIDLYPTTTYEVCLFIDVYNQTFIWPSDDSIAQRLKKGESLSEKQAELKRYRCEVTGLTSAYQHVLKVVNGDQPHEDVYQQGTDTVSQT